MTEPMHVLGLTDMRVSEMRELFEVLDRRGTLVTVDPADGIRAYLSAVATGARCIRHRKSDAILVYNGSGLIGAVGTLLSQYYDVPLLIRLNGDIFRQHRETALEQLRGREWRALAAHLPFALLTRAIFDRADGFVPVASALVDVIHRQTDCPTDQIVPAPNPIRMDEYTPPNEGSDRGDADEADRLLTVTNLNFRGKYEGVTELVDGVVPVLRRRPEVEYVIAGDGRYYERLNRYLEDQVGDGLRRRIRTPGFVDDVATLYWDADVFLYASYIDGYPNVIVEAQAARVPIVTNPAYGIREQIKDGESGIFVDPSDTDELTRTVSWLLDEPAERDRIGRNASDRVETENVPTVVASQLYEAIRTVVAGRECQTPTDEVTSTAEVTIGGAGDGSRRKNDSGGGVGER